MKRHAVWLAIVGMAATWSGVRAAEALKSGPQEGDPLAAFNVTKIAGPEDGVKIGGSPLCYR